jgi:tol-pal system-associated acyl-CoA thioesterase
VSFVHEQRVYIEDTDAGGIVYYVNYLKFMERARTELMRSLGFGKNRIFNDGVMFVVRDVQIKYLGSAVLDDVMNS